MLGRADHLELGDWNATCHRCGRKRKASDLKLQWQGYYVCPEHWEPRHPQDFVRAPTDAPGVPWSQPPADTYLGVCSLQGRSGVAGYCIGDCWLVAYVPPSLYE